MELGLAPSTPRIGPVLQYLRERCTPLTLWKSKQKTLLDSASVPALRVPFSCPLPLSILTLLHRQEQEAAQLLPDPLWIKVKRLTAPGIPKRSPIQVLTRPDAA